MERGVSPVEKKPATAVLLSEGKMEKETAEGFSAVGVYNRSPLPQLLFRETPYSSRVGHPPSRHCLELHTHALGQHLTTNALGRSSPSP